MQVMVIEYAQCAWVWRMPTHPNLINARHPVIDLMAEQRGLADKGGTMRLGLYRV